MTPPRRAPCCSGLRPSSRTATAHRWATSLWEQDSAQLSALLGGLAGAQNQLLLLDAHWRPIFGTQPSQLQALTDSLREHLLSGKSLNSANFLFTAAQVPEAGLYLILQQPQVFTRGTLQLFYTISALCALGCIIVSIFLGLQLSRQIFEPIGRLHRAIRRVRKKTIWPFRVPIDRRENELTELAGSSTTWSPP